jgi:hypothetical protein
VAAEAVVAQPQRVERRFVLLVVAVVVVTVKLLLLPLQLAHRRQLRLVLVERQDRLEPMLAALAVRQVSEHFYPQQAVLVLRALRHLGVGKGLLAVQAVSVRLAV